MIYLCTFKNEKLFIFNNRFESPFNECFREGFKYGETAIISSLYNIYNEKRSAVHLQ